VRAVDERAGGQGPEGCCAGEVAVANSKAMANTVMNAPGSADLRALGCTQVIIADASKTDPTTGAVNVICKVDSPGGALPACDDLAHAYVKADGISSTIKMLSVTTYGPGQMTPSCTRMYTSSGDPYVYKPQ
jgi:hypothetical protein